MSAQSHRPRESPPDGPARGAKGGPVGHPLHHAEFLLTAARDEQLPPPGPPEIAFAGRSNAGKSSAINALANRTRLAFASRTPGRTQQINFFRLRSGALVADLPGYGYAAVPRELKRHWQSFVARYVATRQTLVGLVLVVDARHGLVDADRQLLAGFMPSCRPLLVLATKADKFGSTGVAAAQRTIERDVGAAFPLHAQRISVVAFSATRRLGVAEAERVISAWVTAPEAEPGTPAPGGKEKAPRSRGVTRGPKTPGRVVHHRGHPLREGSGRRRRLVR